MAKSKTHQSEPSFRETVNLMVDEALNLMALPAGLAEKIKKFVMRPILSDLALGLGEKLKHLQAIDLFIPNILNL